MITEVATLKTEYYRMVTYVKSNFSEIWTCLCGRVVSKIRLLTLILTCLCEQRNNCYQGLSFNILRKQMEIIRKKISRFRFVSHTLIN